MKLSERMTSRATTVSENCAEWLEIYADEVGQLEEREARLLAVARAAMTFQKTSNLVWLDNHDEYFELSLALAAVADLL